MGQKWLESFLLAHLVETDVPRQILLFFAPVLNPKLHSNGRTGELQMRPHGFTLQQLSLFCKHCEAEGTVAACRLQFYPSAVGLLFSPEPWVLPHLLQEHFALLHPWPWLTPCRSWQFSGAVLSSVFVSKAQTLPAAAFSSAEPWGAAAVSWHPAAPGRGERGTEQLESFKNKIIPGDTASQKLQRSKELNPYPLGNTVSALPLSLGRIYHFIEAIPLTIIVSMSSISKSAFCSHSSSD